MNIRSVFLAAAMTATVLMSGTYAQDAATSTGNAVQYESVGYSSPASPAVGASYFGYPATPDFGGWAHSSSCASCNSGGCGGGCASGARQAWRDRWEHARHQNDKVCARNRAWPKPFDCADRQLYFSIWEPMLDAGYQKHCTLTSAHFDAETQQLNNYGKSAVAGIMQNMPSHRKTIFIHRDIDQQISDSRMNEVRNAVETWYGSTTQASIAFTDRLPTRSNGDRIEIINGLYREGTPPPTIPVATGGGTVGAN